MLCDKFFHSFPHVCILGLRTGRFICSVHKLLELVDNKCHHPNCNNLCPKKVKPSGCSIVIRGTCSAGHTYIWESSDILVNQNNVKMHVDNLLLSTAIVLSGNHYHKIQILCKFYGLQIPCSTIFHAHQRHYICPAVNAFYLKEQVCDYALVAVSVFLYFQKDKLFNKFKDSSLQLAGDGRCDSPGSSAKYCSYSLMEMTSQKILHVETVDKRDVNLQSPNMEHKAFLWSMSYIKGKITCGELVTDASSSIRKTIGTPCVLTMQCDIFVVTATKYHSIFHSLDVCYKAKKLRKALTKVLHLVHPITLHY